MKLTPLSKRKLPVEVVHQLVEYKYDQVSLDLNSFIDSKVWVFDFSITTEIYFELKEKYLED